MDTQEPVIDVGGKFYGAPPPKVRTAFGAATHVGLVRRNNEDNYAVVQRYRTRRVLLTSLNHEFLKPTREEAYAMSVADGIGGAACGELASQLALTSAWHWGGRESRWLMNVAAHDEAAWDEQMQTLGDLLSEAFRESKTFDPSTRGMGTTLTIAYVVGRHAFIFHIGDSRAYLIRGGAAHRLSTDHTLGEELRLAGAPEEFVRKHRHVLTNCLATGGDSVNVEWRRIDLESGDILVLCTDGLTDLVSDETLAETVRQNDSPQSACDALVKEALARGGKDNVTVVAGKFEFE